MKVKHIFEEHIYLVKNHSVARNPMFSSLSMQRFFQEKMNQYLNPIADIISFNLVEYEFQILIRMRKREDFEMFYMDKHKQKKELTGIPESTYIFSQQMANLQVSFVKKFNFEYKRSGALVARRFEKRLIESEVEMERLIKEMKSGKKIHSYSGVWVNRLMNLTQAMTGVSDYKLGGVRGDEWDDLGSINRKIVDLVGSFKNLPPAQIPNSNSSFFTKYLKNSINST